MVPHGTTPSALGRRPLSQPGMNVDVWESKETFDRFAEEQIGPYSREAGITEQPQISFYDVHN